MYEEVTLDKLEENLVFFNKMYDLVRFIDPTNKKILQQKGSLMYETEGICHKYWESGKLCDNCVSMRAYNCNKSFIKLEQNLKSTILLTAIPIENANRPIVLELLKDVTDSMMIVSGDYSNGHMISTVVSQLNNIVSKDSLTGLYNRRYIYDRLPVDIVSSTINDNPISVIFIDLDCFKLINDRYGHASGDLVLKEIGALINDHIRDDNDWSARYGGDEFIICLNNTSNEKAHKVVSRIKKSIEKLVVTFNENICILISASMGIHTMYKSKLTAEELINHADKKMYESKNLNKNKQINDK